MSIESLFKQTIQLYFVLAPFFVLSMFLSMTRGMIKCKRRKVAIKVTMAVTLISLILFFCGKAIFQVFGITIDSFRIGAGILLFLSAVGLVQKSPDEDSEIVNEDFAVVPLSIPITVGPATVGAIMVMGAEAHTASAKLTGCVSLLIAILAVGIMLYLAGIIENILKHKGIEILSKLTGLVLAALAAQVVMTGYKNMMCNVPDITQRTAVISSQK